MERYSLPQLENDQLSLWYKGVFQDSITENLIDIVESDESLGKSRKKVSFLMAESFQNIVRHGLKDDINEIPGFFGVTNNEEVLSIFSSNNIEQQYSSVLKGKFDQVNEMDQDELKEYYRKILSEGSLSEKGGAGLGLIEMARKSGNPIQFNFEDNGGISEFSMQIDKAIVKEDVSIPPISKGVELYRQFRKQGVLLFFKGDFDTEIVNNVIRMLSQNVEDNDQTGKLIFHAGVELLQNITRHGLLSNDKKEGAFVLAKEGNDIILTSVNYTNDEGKNILKTHLAKLENKGREEMSRLYKETLRESVKNDSNNAGVGLIDIARYGGLINCGFEDTKHGTQVQIEVTIKSI